MLEAVDRGPLGSLTGLFVGLDEPLAERDENWESVLPFPGRKPVNA